MKNTKTKTPDMSAFLSRLKTECSDMKDSIDFYNDIQLDQKQRIAFVRYEDVALDIMSYGQKVYNFLGLDFNEKTRLSIKNATSAKIHGTKRNSYSTNRNKNYNQIVNPWRLDDILTVRKSLY